MLLKPDVIIQTKRTNVIVKEHKGLRDDTHTVGGWSSSSTNGWKLGLGGGTATLRPDLDLRGSWNKKQTQSMLIYQITASILLQLPPDTKLALTRTSQVTG